MLKEELPIETTTTLTYYEDRHTGASHSKVEKSYTKSEINLILDFMYDHRWNIGKDSFCVVDAFKRILEEVEETSVEDVLGNLETMNRESDDYYL